MTVACIFWTLTHFEPHLSNLSAKVRYLVVLSPSFSNSLLVFIEFLELDELYICDALYKLIFFWNEKVACSYWKRLFQFLQGMRHSINMYNIHTPSSNKLKYGLSLLKIHEKYKKYIFRIIFYISLIKNDKQKKGKEINIFKSRNEFRFTQEVARQNIQVSFYIRSTGLWPNTWIQCHNLWQ
jgi:hypothetical protein